MATTANKEEPLAGFYYPEKRKQQVMKKLEEELKIFMKIDFTQDVDEQLKSLRKDDFPKEKTLESITLEIVGLDKEVKAHTFEGGHFTKQYRTFQGLCDKLLQQLDSLDHENNEERKKQRGGAIKEIQEIIGYINGKVHADGKCCSKCELYGTMWQ